MAIQGVLISPCLHNQHHINIYIHIYMHVRKRKELQHMCCKNKKFQLEFLTLPSEVKVSWWPKHHITQFYPKQTQSIPTFPGFVFKNPTAQELHELPEASEFSNIQEQLMVTLCACECCILKSFFLSCAF